MNVFNTNEYIFQSKNHKRYSQMRKRIDPMVINYFYTLQHVIYNYDLPEPGGCDHYVSKKHIVNYSVIS